MILHGNARGNSNELAHHLQKDENERIEIYQIRGFVSRSLQGALQESYAISRATKCKQHLYSLSLNPPKDGTSTPKDFEAAINKVEKQLDLDNQPRAIVFHEKRGLDGEVRRHAHAVWCRIDIESMKAIPLPFTKMQLREVSRDLFIQHNWRMPDGLLNSQNRNPRNFTLAEWQQTKRTGKDPKQLKALFQDAWTLSDGQAALKSALWEQAHATATRMLTTRLEELRNEQSTGSKQKLDALERTCRTTQKQQDIEAQELAEQQEKRQQTEQALQAARLRKDLFGLLDRFTGKRKRTIEQNAAESRHTRLKAQNEQALLQAQYEAALKAIQNQANAQKFSHKVIDSELRKDIRWLERPPESSVNTYAWNKRKPARTTTCTIAAMGRGWSGEADISD